MKRTSGNYVSFKIKNHAMTDAIIAERLSAGGILVKTNDKGIFFIDGKYKKEIGYRNYHILEIIKDEPRLHSLAAGFSTPIGEVTVYSR